MKRSPAQTQSSAISLAHMKQARGTSAIRIAGLIACLLSLSFIGGCSCWKDPLGGNNKNNNSETKKPETLEEMEARRKELLDKAQAQVAPGRIFG